MMMRILHPEVSEHLRPGAHDSRLASGTKWFGSFAWASSLLLLLSDVAAGQVAAGQEDAPQTDESSLSQLAVFRDEITVKARPLASPTPAATVIDRQTIAAANVRTVAELLRHVAGAHVVGNGSRGGLTTVRLRGGDPNFTLVLLDGVPLNNSTNVQGGAVNLASLTVNDLERVEIVRGPASFFYGSSALSGVISLVTRRGAGSAPETSASVDVGDAASFRGKGSVSGGVGSGDYYLGLGWEREEHRTGEDRFEQLNVQGRVGLALGEAATLDLHGRFTPWDVSDYPEASGGPVFGSGELRHSENDEQSLGADLRLGSVDRWRHRVSASLYHHDLYRNSPEVFPLVPPSVEATSFSRARVAWHASTHLIDRVQLGGGLDVEREAGRNESTLSLPPGLGGDVSGDYELRRTSPGIYAEAITELGRILIEIGLRTDFPSHMKTQWSPRVALRYQFANGDTSARGTVSRAFRLPSFFSLGSPPQLGGNPDLRPERTVGGDVGLEHEVEAIGLTINTSVFRNNYADLIDFDFDTFRHVNRAKVKATGLELSAAWTPVPRVALAGDLTFQSVEELSGQPPLHQPKWLGSTRLTFSPVMPLTLRLEASSVSKSLDRQIPVSVRDFVDGYVVVNVAAAWRPSDRWIVRGRVDNLADRAYEHFIGFPEPGLSGRLSLTYTLRTGRTDEAFHRMSPLKSEMSGRIRYWRRRAAARLGPRAPRATRSDAATFQVWPVEAPATLTPWFFELASVQPTMLYSRV